MEKKTLHRLTACAMMTALICVLGPMSVPIGPIPVSLANLVIYLTVFILGMTGSTISVAVYLLLGAVGMPVFSGYAGGLAKLAGPTGGYLVGYLAVTLIGGLAADKSWFKPLPTAIALVVGTAVLYLLGTAWFVFSTGTDIAKALALCVYPFIALDLGKIVLACGFGSLVRKALIRANLLPA